MMESAAGGAWGQWSPFLLPLILALWSLWRWRSDLSFEGLRPYGVTQNTARLFRNLVLALILYCLPVTAFEMFQGGVPVWLLLFVPAAAALSIVVIMAGQLLARDALWHHDEQGRRTHIKWARFARVISSPIAAALAPITNVAIYRLPDVIRSFGIDV